MKSSFDSVLPEEMKSEGLFCLWKYEFIDGKLKKPPHNPKYPEFKIRMTDRDKFVPYCEAVEKATYGYSRGQKGYGLDIGIFKDDYMPLGCIDLDHCMIDGKLSPLADDVLRLTEGTYTEISPGGDGFHIFFRFESVPEGYGQQGKGIECYLAGKVDHTMSVTGKPYKNAPPVLKDLSEVLPQIFDKYLPKLSSWDTSTRDTRGDIQPSAMERPDSEVLKGLKNIDLWRACFESQEKFESLIPDNWRKIDGSLDHSKADFHLCRELASLTYCNTEQIDRIFRQTVLMRPKWDDKRPQGTYGTYTMQKAIADIQSIAKEFISDEEQDFNDFMTRIQGEAYKPYSTGIKELDDILDGGFIMQTLAVLTAAPAAGKTTLAQQIFEKMGADTLFINLEMSKDQLRAKSLSRIISESGGDMSPNDILRGYKWTSEQREMVRSASEIFRNTVCPHMKYIHPESNSVDYIKNLIEEYAVSFQSMGKRAPIVVIDYLHLLSDDKADDAQTIIKKAVKMLKDYAINHNSIVFLISASNRDSNKDGKLTLESGRDSSAIEYSSDVQFALNHSKLFYAKKDKKKEIDAGELLNCDEREMVLQVLKNRMGAVGKTADLVLDAKHSRFYSPTFAEDDL